MGVGMIMDLSIATLAKACRGNVASLPSLMVHNDDVWPVERPMLDSKNKIHMRRKTFYAVVVPALPVRAGLWHRLDVQEFFFDLQPHHLQGSADAPKAKGYRHSRALVRADSFGRIEGDPDYGTGVAGNYREADIAADVRAAKAAGSSRSIRSSVFDPVDRRR
jgi:hypothetical protein